VRAADPTWPKEMTFTIMATENPAEVTHRWSPILAQLEADLGVKVKPVVADFRTIVGVRRLAASSRPPATIARGRRGPAGRRSAGVRNPHPREDLMVLNRKPTVGRTALVALLPILMAASSAHAQAPRIDQATLEEPNQKTREVSTDELKRTLATKTAIVLDARPYREFAMSHVPGAQNVAPKPGVAISMYVSDVKEVERLADGDKSKPLILYCNGPFCGKSKRLSEELLAAGFTNVRRYQLGIPVWRALGGLTEIELEGVQHVFQSDRTAVFLDARSAEEFRAGTLPGARNIPQSAVEPGKDVGEVRKAKDDGRLPMEDHNTRIIIFGRDAVQARGLAEAIAREAFHNVAYFPGSFDALRSTVK
jgi:rhodanese-related sulfurtransferase